MSSHLALIDNVTVKSLWWNFFYVCSEWEFLQQNTYFCI